MSETTLEQLPPHIGFLGAGKMASALAAAIRRHPTLATSPITVCEKIPTTADTFSHRFQATPAPSPSDLLHASDVILLCVKPQDLGEALSQLPASTTDSPHPLFISIAAGIPLSKLEKWLGPRHRICRAMPNTAAEVGLSATALCHNPHCTLADKHLALQIFQAAGLALELPENLFDAVTALSGSGPAYAFLLLEAMADGGVAAGLPRAEALKLAAWTLRGAAELAIQTTTHPAQLREAVTSPAGTTAAALLEMETSGFRGIVARAVLAAAQRAANLNS